MTYSYMPGFGNDFESESLPGSLPQGRNSPSGRLTVFMPSNCPALLSRRRGARTSALGFTA
jgi:hypothetical protein